MADPPPQPRTDWPIYLFIPNLIGYARIIANGVALSVAFTNKRVFATLYLISFICDELDGRFARMLNQRSTFGAVLDMVTDRVSTASLLVLLTHFYKSWYGQFLGLLALDISSHWLQVYGTFLASKTSHKDMADSKSPLLRLYYRQRFFMGYCAIGAEVSYLLLYMLGTTESVGNTPLSPVEVIKVAALDKSAYGILLVAALPGWAIKQLVNLVQMCVYSSTWKGILPRPIKGAGGEVGIHMLDDFACISVQDHASIQVLWSGPLLYLGFVSSLSFVGRNNSNDHCLAFEEPRWNPLRKVAKRSVPSLCNSSTHSNPRYQSTIEAPAVAARIASTAVTLTVTATATDHTCLAIGTETPTGLEV